MREGAGGGDKLTEEKDLCRLLALLDEFLGFLQLLVNLSGNPGRLCLFVTRCARSSSVSSGGGMKAAAKGSLVQRRLETAFMRRGRKRRET
jgi:hypothetical protein